MDADVLHRRRRERRAFHELFGLKAEGREARLREIEDENAALAAALRRLLAKADVVVRADARRAAAEDDAAEVSDRIGTTIGGHFVLLRRLGVGGMGEVYLAERSDGIEQRVALKLVRDDVPVPPTRALRERQILARLQHPHIAGLVDAGVTATGQPWFAMDYVDGERITDWCDRRAVALSERARLFARVCRAVQFAHRNLVLHRDLKPSNILVDGEGRPKLLDFGIAKLLDVTDAQETQTFAFTPAYAAPEQLRGEAATTVTDVYQLGLVLYELISGVSARQAREAAPHDETMSLPRPEQALAAVSLKERAAAERIARRRGSALEKFRRVLKGDLSRIVAKATASDPRERYDTALAFADDLERWADGRPVAAQRGSFAYRANKLIRRHAVAAAIVAALSVGLVATSLVAVQRARVERQQRELAERQRQEAQQQRELAERQRRLAEEQRRRSETLLGFLRDVFHEAEPNQTGGATLDAGELLRRATARLDQREDLDSVTRAVLLTEIADVFTGLGLRAAALPAAERAERELEAARETHPGDYLHSVEVLLNAQQEAGRWRDSLDLAERGLPLAASMPEGSRRWHPLLLRYRGAARHALGQTAAAEQDLRNSLAEYGEAGMQSGDSLALTLSDLAHLVYRKGDARQALELLQRQADVLAADPKADKLNQLQLRQNIAQIQLLSLGDAPSALAALQSLSPRFDALQGPAHDRSIGARTRLAMAYSANGDWPTAATTLQANIALSKDGSISINPIIRRQLQQVSALFALLRSDTQTALHLLRTTTGAPAEAPGYGDVWGDWLLGEALLQDRQFAAAAEQLDRTMQAARQQYGEAPTTVVGQIEDSRGRCALMQGDFAAATSAFERAVAQFRASQGDSSPSAVRSQAHASWAEMLATKQPAALERLRAQRDELVRALGTDNRPQVWQLDLLLDRLAVQFRQPRLDEARRRRAEAAVAAATGKARAPSYLGLAPF